MTEVERELEAVRTLAICIDKQVAILSEKVTRLESIVYKIMVAAAAAGAASGFSITQVLQ